MLFYEETYFTKIEPRNILAENFILKIENLVSIIAEKVFL